MAQKMWTGRTDGELFKTADDFNSSIQFDCKMYKQDILGSIAHATMLAKQGIITTEESLKIIAELNNILSDIQNGILTFDMEAEDIHMFIESVLTQRIGDLGKKLHTARSRNDQVALDLRMKLKDDCDVIVDLIKELISALVEQAQNNLGAIMPGYTHLQRAQPILFSHQLLAYVEMLKRDCSRISDAKKRMNICPLGSCALAGTTFDTDRQMVASLLGFDGISANSIDGVSDRDFCVELLAGLSILMMHLSRLSEEIILWTSLEFGFITLSDAFTTGSSIMPQKKNSDMAELVRGKTGRVYGDLIATLTMLKGLPLAYNKDMQEDKESVFDGVETAIKCLQVFAPMIKTMTVNLNKMLLACKTGYINATDLADYLTKKGMPFRTAYKIVGELVKSCIEKNITLEQVSIEEFKSKSDLFSNDVYDAIDLKTCVEKRISAGGTGLESVKAQIKSAKEFLEQEK